ncbi:LANO_0F01508g1_1 [Lachancea nothofagi CBS 11611]|uniref:LANO_0F01508g1_1 n=1 Tax=Lachancea nothofagi CBS 11611 TaxID=1266666 RepID=A0A1G4K688_9SACH|nr:LANO_0F01508g1_1 [Lachancea nothofagi CBS 11611]
MTSCTNNFSHIRQALEPCVSEGFNSDEDPILRNVLSTKLLANLNILRKMAVESELGLRTERPSDLNSYRNNFNELECTALMVRCVSTNAIKEQYAQQTELSRRKRLSVDFDSEKIPEELEKSDNSLQSSTVGSSSCPDDDESLGDLRNRLLGNKLENHESGAGLNTSMEKQMQVQDNLQEELINDMSQLVSGLRMGAEAFQTALNEDSTILKATELGLQATSRSLTNLGGKLKKYHNSKVGLLFYLGCILFMFLSLIVTYLVIKIFPKM